MKYNWAAIPEVTWTAFSAAFAGLVGAVCVATGAPEYLTVAIVTFVGAFFRMVIALIGAILSTQGTVTTGTGNDPNPVPPSP